MNESMISSSGYKCPVKKCDKVKRNFTLLGLCKHIIACHSRYELEKRLKVKYAKE